MNKIYFWTFFFQFGTLMFSFIGFYLLRIFICICSNVIIFSFGFSFWRYGNTFFRKAWNVWVILFLLCIRKEICKLFSSCILLHLMLLPFGSSVGCTSACTFGVSKVFQSAHWLQLKIRYFGHRCCVCVWVFVRRRLISAASTDCCNNEVKLICLSMTVSHNFPHFIFFYPSSPFCNTPSVDIIN